jgi:hypothetical protein
MLGINSNGSHPPDIATAAREVEMAQVEFAARLEKASQSSRQLVQTTVRTLRPIAVGAVVVAGVVAIALLARLIRRRPARLTWQPALSVRSPPVRQSSLFKNILRSALASLIGVAIRRATERALALPAHSPTPVKLPLSSVARQP